MWIASTEHSRNIDRRATEEFGLPANVLMERAGLAVFEAVRELLPDGGRITVLCGKGGNGGDGFVVARVARDNADLQRVIDAVVDDRHVIRANTAISLATRIPLRTLPLSHAGSLRTSAWPPR